MRFALLLFWAFFSPLLLTTSQEKGRIDAEGEIVARVNEEVITAFELDKKVRELEKIREQKILRQQALQMMVFEKVLLQQVKKDGISVNGTEIDQFIEREAKAWGSKEELFKWEKETKGSVEAYREEVKRNLLIQKLYRFKYRGGVQGVEDIYEETVSPEELRQFYEANKDKFSAIEELTLRRITLTYANPQEREEKKKQMESIERRLKKGADFPMMAFYFSDVGKEQNGSMPPKRRGATSLPAEVEKELFGQVKEGEPSRIFEFDNSWNMFRIERKHIEKEKSFEEAQPRLRLILEQRKRMENYRRLENELAKNVYIWPRDLLER